MARTNPLITLEYDRTALENKITNNGSFVKPIPKDVINDTNVSISANNEYSDFLYRLEQKRRKGE